MRTLPYLVIWIAKWSICASALVSQTFASSGSITGATKYHVREKTTSSSPSGDAKLASIDQGLITSWTLFALDMRPRITVSK